MTLATTTNTDRYLTVKEVADYIHCDRTTIYSWIKHRGMPVSGFPGALRFCVADVDAWMRAGGAR